MNSPHYTTLSERISILIGSGSISAFAQKCGLSEGSIRQYLSGAIPRMDRVVAMAKANGVRLEWLATGQGDWRAEGERKSKSRQEDKDLLCLILENLLSQDDCTETRDDFRELAAAVIDIHSTISSLELSTRQEQLAAIRFAAEHRRRSARKPRHQETFVASTSGDIHR